MYENIRIAQDIDDIVSASDLVSTFQVIEVLKGGAKNHVVVGILDGVKVVVKRFLTGDTAQTVRRLRDELDFVGQYMNAGPHQMNRCHLVLPDAGIVALGFVPGVRLANVLGDANPDRRADLMGHSGAWLSAYVGGRHRQSTFAARRWVRDLDDVELHRTEHQQTLRDLTQSLSDQAARIAGCPVTHAAIHGDYVSLNAHYDDGVIYGVDVQGESWMPYVKDVAGFLVWEGMRRPTNSVQRRFGLARSDVDAFLSRAEVPECEITTTLPFMIGLQLRRRLIERSRANDGAAHVRTAIMSYLADMSR